MPLAAIAVVLLARGVRARRLQRPRDLATLVFLRADSEVDVLHDTILGWSGWFIPAAVVGVLLATKSYRTLERLPEDRTALTRRPRADWPGTRALG